MELRPKPVDSVSASVIMAIADTAAVLRTDHIMEDPIDPDTTIRGRTTLRGRTTGDAVDMVGTAAVTIILGCRTTTITLRR